MSSSRKRPESNRQKVIATDEIPHSSVKQAVLQLNLNKGGLEITQLSANNTPSSQSASLMQQSQSYEQVPKQGLIINKKTNSKASQYKINSQKQQALISTSNAHAINSVRNVAQTPGSAGPPNPNQNSSFSCLIQKQLTSSNYGHPMDMHSSQVTRSLEKISSNGSRNHGNFALTSADHHRQVQTASSQHNSVSLQSVKKGSAGIQQSQYRGAQPQQKNSIKAFKRQQLDPNLTIHEPSKVVMSQMSVSSSVVTVKSGRRPSSNFVSIGGASKVLETPDQTLPANQNLKNSLPSGQTNQNRQGNQNQNAIGQKIGIFRADRLSKQLGIVSNPEAQSSTQLRQGAGIDSRNKKERMSSSSINSNGNGVHLPESMRDVSQEKTNSIKSNKDRSNNNSASKAAEASYCPTILNLNQSQEILLRQGQGKNSTAANQQYAQHINSTNQAFLLPGHMIKANGPSSMQAQSKAHQFLPPHSSQNMILSASFEKLNMLGGKKIPAMSGGIASQQNGHGATSTLSQSSQNTLRTQHQKLLQHHSNMQNYLKGATPGQSQHATKPNSGGTALPQTNNLKVKKRIKTSNTFLTPQRLKKGKESEKQNNIVDGTNASLLIVSQNGNKQESKAQQYLRNSFMVKNHQAQLVGSKIHSSQEEVSATGVSISPRQNSMKNITVGLGISRNTTAGGAKTMIGLMPTTSLTTANINSNSMLTSTNNRQGHSPLSGLPEDQSKHQLGGNQKQVHPKNLNILTKSKQQAGQGHGVAEQPQKMMIDKKTYQDLMNYLVKAEVKRLQQKIDKPGQLHPNMTTQNQSAVMKPSNSNSNLQSMSSSQQKQKLTPKQSQQNSSSKHKTGVDGFQSQQSISRLATWQPQMALTQTSLSNHLLKELPIQLIDFGGESQSAETQKQTQEQSRYTQGKKHGILPQNAASKSKVAVSIFMPNNVLPLNGSQKAQMMKTTISQNSQSRDASLKSHNTNGQIIQTKSRLKQTVIYNGGKQSLVTKQVRIASSKPKQQLFIKGSKQAQQRSGTTNLQQAGANTRNQNQVFTLSVSNTNNNQFLSMAQASPNQTAIYNQMRASKKGSLVVTTIPTKIIKSRSLIRGGTINQTVNGQICMNVQKNQQAEDNLPQETLKNNFMHSSDQDFTQIRKKSDANSSSASDLRELHLKAKIFPFKDRVQSSKSSTTHNQSQNQQQRPSLATNNGAKSHRESQRYFSRPSDEQNTLNQGARVTIKQSIEKISHTKQPVTHKSQSKDHKRSRQVADSNLKGSRQSATRYSNSSMRGKLKPNTAESSNDKKRSGKRANNKVDYAHDEVNKRNSLVTMLPLDVMSGPAHDDFENGRIGRQTLRSGANLIQTVVLRQNDFIKGKKRKKISSDIGIKDAVEDVLGGNFNTFGEQSSDTFRQKRKGDNEENNSRARGKLIERIEHQIETELNQNINSSMSVPVFEVNELSNHSIGTHESNTIEMMAKPPQNSLMDINHLQISPDLDTIESKEGTVKIEKQSQRQTKTSHNSLEKKYQNLKNFHYSGSFGISACSPSQENLQELERAAIAIDASELYQEVKGELISRSNTIEDRPSSKAPKFSASKEFEDLVVGEQRHQTLQENQTSSGKKGHFQLINMSFSQENERENNHTSEQKILQGKIPHNTIQTYQEYEDMVEGRSPVKLHQQFKMVFNDMTKNQDTSVRKVSDSINSNAEYRKQLLLQMLPQYEFDQMHQDYVSSIVESNQITEAHNRQSHMAVSKGAAQLLRLINMSLGKSQSDIFLTGMEDHESNNDYEGMSFDDKLETNTVVENECDSELAQIYTGSGTNVPNDIQSPSVASERQIKSFETTSLQSPSNSTRIELQTPSNQTSQLPSHQASQQTTHITPYSVDEETRLVLLQSSEPESHRKQGGAFAVCSPKTAAQAAAIYEDGANGGRQAFVTRSVRHSNQVDDGYQYEGISKKDLILPQFGVQALGPEEEDGEEENQSFQTMREDDEEAQSLGEIEQVTSFYGPEKPQYEDMVSIIQGEGYLGELIDDNIVSQMDQLVEPLAHEDQDCDTGGGSQAESHSPHSIKQSKKKFVLSRDLNKDDQTEDLEDEDQFLFAENLNKQYADAMEQRKYLKMISKPRQKSC